MIDDPQPPKGGFLREGKFPLGDLGVET